MRWTSARAKAPCARLLELLADALRGRSEAAGVPNEFFAHAKLDKAFREQRIAAKAKDANKVNARVFNFGVGFDVNSRLLDRISRDHRGQSVYVRPNENIEASVSALYRKIGSPVLTDIAINVEFDAVVPASTTPLISRTYPRQLTDLFQGEQLVWVGR